ncbi:hypothetical protein DPEC_G00333120 [Dallia pectoralis]|uniref:Uncharacterized protein n=1 Tax=Dallia pectoralis TaxID=75939 RepID=A0ACC2F6C1_DALPE|nr:hypothetical protein DPEC_G00333120 [Dallia pectoralis]
MIEKCPVTGIQVSTDDQGVKRVKVVETTHGTIQTPVVVNCAGVWAAKLGQMTGVKVPLISMHHAYVVTERIEGIQVIENCPVTGIQVSTDDLGVKRVKAVETTHGTIQTPVVVNCAESFTADHKPLMGEAPEVRGFFLGCGFNSAGDKRRPVTEGETNY